VTQLQAKTLHGVPGQTIPAGRNLVVAGDQFAAAGFLVGLAGRKFQTGGTTFGAVRGVLVIQVFALACMHTTGSSMNVRPADWQNFRRVRLVVISTPDGIGRVGLGC